MQTVLILALLLATALSLGGAALFLYRYLVRSRLFPQLPRVWSSDRQRAIILGAAGLAFLVAFIAYSGLTRSPAVPPASAPPGPAAMAATEGKPRPEPQVQDPPAPPPLSPAATVLSSQTPVSAPEPEPALPGPLPGGEAPPAQTSAPPQPAPPAPVAAPAAPPAPEPGPASPTLAPPPPITAPAAPVAAPAPAAPVAAPPLPEPTAPAAPAPAPPTSPDKPSWVVVMESHQNRAAADKAQAKYAHLEQPVQVWEVDLPKKGRWFRVCLGRFGDMTQAQAQGQAWKKQGLSPDPFVARMP